MALWYCNFFVFVWFKSLPQENHLLNTAYALCPWINEILRKTFSRTPHQTFQKAYRSSQASRRHCFVFLVVLIILLLLPSRLFAWVSHLTLWLRSISSIFRHLTYVKSMGKNKSLLWAIGGLGGLSPPHLSPLSEERCYKDCLCHGNSWARHTNLHTMLQTGSLTPWCDFSFHGDIKTGLWFERVFIIL